MYDDSMRPGWPSMTTLEEDSMSGKEPVDEEEQPSEDEMDATLEESFPASDPPSWSHGHDAPLKKSGDGE
jgi:hypothetical protein